MIQRDELIRSMIEIEDAVILWRYHSALSTMLGLYTQDMAFSPEEHQRLKDALHTLAEMQSQMKRADAAIAAVNELLFPDWVDSLKRLTPLPTDEGELS